MGESIQFPGEDQSNAVRGSIAAAEPASLRTFTPTLAVIDRSAGVFHWTPEGRRLYDYSSGVLVANLGHNPRRWTRRLMDHLKWTPENLNGSDEYFAGSTLTAYNATTPLEAEACARLLANLQAAPGGQRMHRVLWAASGSEAIQKALWCSLKRNPQRQMILATRHGFHGKKGLAGAVTGSEKDAERDPRVRFIGFPMDEIQDVGLGDSRFDPQPYRDELDRLWNELGEQIGCLITEPYLGGGGSYHPPAAYLQLLQDFCREHDIIFILDEVQSNFGRTGYMYAFESYGIEPDIVCLGKGLGNGIPVSAAAGSSDVLDSLTYGATSDTWSANPISCAAVLATLDEFESTDVLERTRALTPRFVKGLNRLKDTGIIGNVRGEGLVFGIECNACGEQTAGEVANSLVKAAYLGDSGGDGIHLLGPLAGTVIRISPPLTITDQQADESLELLWRIASRVSEQLSSAVQN